MRLDRIASVLAAVFCALVAVLALSQVATPVLDILRYALAFGWSVTLPGMAVYRWAKGRPESLIADLSLGTATGLATQLAAWFAFTSLGLAAWQGLYPILVLGTLAVLPSRGRTFSLARYPSQTGQATGVLAFGSFSLTMLAVLDGPTWRSLQLPPNSVDWYQDLLYFLGGIHELMRTANPVQVQVAAFPWEYHWYAQAHMAALSWTSAVSPEVISARLWLVPIVALLIGLLITLVSRLTGSDWPGAVISWLLPVGGQFSLPSWIPVPGLTPLVFFSPSHVFALPIMLLLLHEVWDAVTARRPIRAWVPLLGAISVALGAKSTVIPTAFAAVLLLVTVLLWRRDWPAFRRALAVLGLLGIGLVFAIGSSGDAGAGTQFLLLSTLAFSSLYRKIYGPEGWFPDPLAVVSRATSIRGLATILASLAVYPVATLWLWVGGLAFRRKYLAAWLLGGVVIAGFSAAMLIGHPGGSQIYFLAGTTVAAYVLAAWGLFLAVDRAQKLTTAKTIWRVVIFATLLGGAIVVALSRIPTPATNRHLLLYSLVILGGLLTLALGAVAVAWRLRGRAVGALTTVALASFALGGAILPGVFRLMPPVAALALVFLLGAAVRPRWIRHPMLPGAVIGLLLAGFSVALIQQPSYQPAAGESRTAVTDAELAATQWLREHAEPFDLTATNVHCRAAGARVFCDNRTFWVSGFSGRRMLVEGWGYTPQTLANNGKDDKQALEQPFFDQELYRLNEAVFYHPTADSVAKLREQQHVKWLFADARHTEFKTSTPVSPELEKYATKVFQSGPVTIYRLDR